MNLEISTLGELVASMEIVSPLMQFCIKKGGTTFEMEFYGPPDTIEEGEAYPELFISPKLLKKAKLVKKGKKEKGGGYLANQYFLKEEINKEFTEWFKEHNLMGFGALNTTIYNKDGARVAYFAESIIKLYGLNKKEITQLKKQLKPFEKNLKYYESEEE